MPIYIYIYFYENLAAIKQFVTQTSANFWHISWKTFSSKCIVQWRVGRGTCYIYLDKGIKWSVEKSRKSAIAEISYNEKNVHEWWENVTRREPIYYNDALLESSLQSQQLVYPTSSNSVKSFHRHRIFTSLFISSMLDMSLSPLRYRRREIYILELLSSILTFFTSTFFQHFPAPFSSLFPTVTFNHIAPRTSLISSQSFLSYIIHCDADNWIISVG